MERREGLKDLEPDGEAAPEEGGGATSVRHVLLSSGIDSPPIWGGDLDFFRGDVQESGGGTRRFSKLDNKAEGNATERRDLEEGDIREGPLEGRS